MLKEETNDKSVYSYCCTYFCCPYLWVLPDAKASSEILYTSVYALFVGILFGGILQAIFGTGSEVITQSLEWITMVGNGYVALLQMLIMPLVFVSIVGGIYQDERKRKNQKNQLYCVGYFVGHDSNRCTDRNRDGYVVWFRRCEFY